MFASKNIKLLLNHYREIALLNQIGSVLDWDLNVNLPNKAIDSRAAQSAYVTKLVSDKWLEKNFRVSLEKANSEKNLNLEERAVVRNLNHSAKYYHKVPQKIIIEFSEETSKAFITWREAREKNDFSIFELHLKKIIRLNQIIADKLGFKDNPYDALLDLYEPELTSKECKKIFTNLTKEIGALLKEIKKSEKYGSKNELVEKEYPLELQKKLADFVLTKIGYDFNAGRQDISAHPFTSELGQGDIRVTNRYSPHNFIEPIMIALHEGGHALYEQGVNEEYALTPLAGGVSLGIHESQSRFWENQVGRSKEFVKFLEPVLKAFYPKELEKENIESLFLNFNRVEPGLIRVEADEVTYNLHIALRFELEEALINEKIKVKDLPEIWNEKMKSYLSIVPPTNSLGVLQDVHWSYGNFGYFPTYTLGNLYAAQLTYFLKKEISFSEEIGSGRLGPILSWMRENIHKHGSLYWPKDLITKITGENLNSDYFSKYLNDKYLEIYS